jgi:KRAB domain-containing zinc finger protein
MKNIQKLNATLPSDLLFEPEASAQGLPNSKKFKCHVCSRFFSSKHCLTEHGYRHSGERVYSCTTCKKTFKYASQLSLHKKSHIQKNELRWPKLTDLLKLLKKEEAREEIIEEKVDLPLISSPKEVLLPIFSTIGANMVVE